MKKISQVLLLFSLTLLARDGLPDVIRLKNGTVVEGKIAKMTDEIVKMRVARRGRIFTAFYSRANITSITKTPDDVNRLVFQKAGVRNPPRNFEPVYYGGGAVRTAARGVPKKRGIRPTARTTSKKRGVEARRERFKSGLSRFAKKETTATTSTGGAGASTTTGISASTSSSPSTTGTASTTR